MTTEARRPSQLVGDRIKEVREQLGLSQRELARRIAEDWQYNEPDPKRPGKTKPLLLYSAIARIETNARQVAVEELLVIAAALNVPVIHLLTPADEYEMYQVTPLRAITSHTARRWISGETRLIEQDESIFFDDDMTGACKRTQDHEDVMNSLQYQKALALGVKSIFDVTPKLMEEATDEQIAAIDMLFLRQGVQEQRHRLWQVFGQTCPLVDELDAALALLVDDPEGALDAYLSLHEDEGPLGDLMNRIRKANHDAAPMVEWERAYFSPDLARKDTEVAIAAFKAIAKKMKRKAVKRAAH